MKSRKCHKFPPEVKKKIMDMYRAGVKQTVIAKEVDINIYYLFKVIHKIQVEELINGSRPTHPYIGSNGFRHRFTK